MNIEHINRHRTYKTVFVGGITTETDSEILDAALTATGETRSSLFGTRVTRSANGTAVVTLNTD